MWGRIRSHYQELLCTFGLAFRDSADEAEFTQQYVLGAARASQAFMAVGALAFLSYVTQDQAIAPNDYHDANLIRIFYSTPLLLLAAFLLFFASARRFIEPLIVFSAFVLISAQAWIFSLLPNGFTYATTGASIIFMSFATAAIVRISYLSVIALLSMMGTIGGHLYADNAEPGWLIINVLGIMTAVMMGMISSVIRERMARSQFIANRALNASHARAEALLSSMLPEKIVNRIKAGETDIADLLGNVSIVFADIAGFTSLSRRLSPTDLIRLLDSMFSRFDKAAARYGMEKITTIGDAYMAVGGMDGVDSPEQMARNAANLAIAIRKEVAAMIEETGYPINVRVGVHIGPVVAGVVGDRRPTFDCWGDTVRVASGLEGHATPGHILISDNILSNLGSRADVGDPNSFTIKGVEVPVTARDLHAVSG
jgi:class 3 adenylate cyclase